MIRKIGGGCEVSDTLNAFDNAESRTPILIVEIYGISKCDKNTIRKIRFN